MSSILIHFFVIFSVLWKKRSMCKNNKDFKSAVSTLIGIWNWTWRSFCVHFKVTLFRFTDNQTFNWNVSRKGSKISAFSSSSFFPLLLFSLHSLFSSTQDRGSVGEVEGRSVGCVGYVMWCFVFHDLHKVTLCFALIWPTKLAGCFTSFFSCLTNNRS